LVFILLKWQKQDGIRLATVAQKEASEATSDKILHNN
jgi:hypothetical protein